MDEVLNNIYDNAIADMEKAFINLLCGKNTMTINTDRRMKSVFGKIKLVELIPNEDSVLVKFMDEGNNLCEEQLIDFSLLDIIGIGEYADDFGSIIR